MNFLQKSWLKIKELLKQGLTPKQLALSIVISILVSIFPIFGISTIILTALAVPLKLNLPIMIAVSYVAEFLKALLIIPFITVGGLLFGADHSLLTYDAIKASYQISFWETLKALSYELLCGFVGWALLAVPASIVLYFILKTIFVFFDNMKKKRLATKQPN